MKKSSGSKKKRDSRSRTLEELLAAEKIKTWDILIVGDGSGSNWDREAGWAATSVERVTMERKVWAGAMNRGTVNVAEVMAYLQPLEWFAARERDRRQKKQPTRAYQVHILTDSEYCRQAGASGGVGAGTNAGLWAAFGAFARLGFVLHWHHIPRNSCGLHEFADSVSKLARRRVKGYHWEQVLSATDDHTTTVYDVNPAEPG